VIPVNEDDMQGRLHITCEKLTASLSYGSDAVAEHAGIPLEDLKRVLLTFWHGLIVPGIDAKKMTPDSTQSQSKETGRSTEV
jgi:hypothetical protein